MTISIREEAPADHAAIKRIHNAAFEQKLEADLVDALRADGDLTVSLLAEDHDCVVGHIAFSPVTIEHNPLSRKVAGLGPLGVVPGKQRKGIGLALMAQGLARCRHLGLEAVAVLGDPSYYAQAGFKAARNFGLHYSHEIPSECFMALELKEKALAQVSGRVFYATAFSMFD